MELLGLCNICSKPDAMNTCSLCGRLVCSSCFDAVNRICIICKSGKF